jgi:hypothetical protein
MQRNTALGLIILIVFIIVITYYYYYYYYYYYSYDDYYYYYYYYPGTYLIHPHTSLHTPLRVIPTHNHQQ